MITLKNLTQYEPEFKDLLLFNAVFLESADGLDWYYHMSRFQADTLKICYDENGVIRSFSYQADRLFPLGMSVTEVKVAAIPEGLNIHGEWAWDGAKIIPRQLTKQEIQDKAQERKSALLNEAADKIAPLHDASELGIATDDELSALERWKDYRVKLNRLDISTVPDINWPEMPV